MNIDKGEFRKFLKKTIIKAQHCQRNWDLSKQIPQEDLDVIIAAATECPSKQNLDFYSLLVIQNQEIQQKIYENTYTRPAGDPRGRKNPQVLANTLLVFVPKDPNKTVRNLEMNEYVRGNMTEKTKNKLDHDTHQAIGVAAGFVNVVAQSLGYATGCNICMNSDAIKKILGIEKHPELMMGIGFKDPERNRKEEHVTKKPVQAYAKIPIDVQFIS
jgi:nitroreductase